MPRQAESFLSTPELRPGNEAARTSRLRHGGTWVVAGAAAAVPSVGRRSSYSRRFASSAPSRRLGYARAGRASAPVINERGGLTAFVCLQGRQRLLGRFSKRWQGVGSLEVCERFATLEAVAAFVRPGQRSAGPVIEVGGWLGLGCRLALLMAMSWCGVAAWGAARSRLAAGRSIQHQSNIAKELKRYCFNIKKG